MDVVGAHEKKATPVLQIPIPSNFSSPRSTSSVSIVDAFSPTPPRDGVEALTRALSYASLPQCPLSGTCDFNSSSAAELIQHLQTVHRVVEQELEVDSDDNNNGSFLQGNLDLEIGVPCLSRINNSSTNSTNASSNMSSSTTAATASSLLNNGGTKMQQQQQQSQAPPPKRSTRRLSSMLLKFDSLCFLWTLESRVRADAETQVSTTIQLISNGHEDPRKSLDFDDDIQPIRSASIGSARNYNNSSGDDLWPMSPQIERRLSFDNSNVNSYNNNGNNPSVPELAVPKSPGIVAPGEVRPMRESNGSSGSIQLISSAPFPHNNNNSNNTGNNNNNNIPPTPPPPSALPPSSSPIPSSRSPRDRRVAMFALAANRQHNLHLSFSSLPNGISTAARVSLGPRYAITIEVPSSASSPDDDDSACTNMDVIPISSSSPPSCSSTGGMRPRRHTFDDAAGSSSPLHSPVMMGSSPLFPPISGGGNRGRSGSGGANGILSPTSPTATCCFSRKNHRKWMFEVDASRAHIPRRHERLVSHGHGLVLLYPTQQHLFGDFAVRGGEDTVLLPLHIKIEKLQ